MQCIKCVCVGDGYVGKSALLSTYATNAFPTLYLPTVFDNFSVNALYDSRPINLGLWDTAGQDEYARIRPLSYPLTDVFIICFSVVSPSSFANVRANWYPEIKHFAQAAPIILVGTKIDLREDRSTLAELAKHGKEPIATSEGYKLAKELGMTAYYEASALRGKGVAPVFDAVMRAVIEPQKPKTRKPMCILM